MAQDQLDLTPQDTLALSAAMALSVMAPAALAAAPDDSENCIAAVQEFFDKMTSSNYTYLYAALDWNEYWANENVYAAGSTASSAQEDSHGEHDLGAKVLDRLGGDALDVRLGAHGHEDRRLDVAMWGVQHAGTRMRRRILGDQVEFKKALVHKLELLGCGSYANHYTGNPQEAPTRQKLVQRKPAPCTNAPG